VLLVVVLHRFRQLYPYGAWPDKPQEDDTRHPGPICN